MRIYFISLLIICFVFTVGCDTEDTIKVISIKCHLTVEVNKNEVKAVLSFKNTSSSNIYILKWSLLMEDELTFSPFEIIYNNIRLRYQGDVLKRSKPTFEDFYELKGGTEVVTEVMLHNYYDFSKKGTYKIKYYTLNYTFSNKNNLVAKEFFDINSNVVEIDIK